MSRNQVSVTLSGRDQLSGVVNQASNSLKTLSNIGRIALGVGLIKAVADTAKAIKRMAGDFDGPLREGIENAERSLRSFNQILVSILVNQRDFERANNAISRSLANVLSVVQRVVQNFGLMVKVLKEAAIVASVFFGAGLVAAGGRLLVMAGRAIYTTGVMASFTAGIKTLSGTISFFARTQATKLTTWFGRVVALAKQAKNSTSIFGVTIATLGKLLQILAGPFRAVFRFLGPLGTAIGALSSAIALNFKELREAFSNLGNDTDEFQRQIEALNRQTRLSGMTQKQLEEELKRLQDRYTTLSREMRLAGASLNDLRTNAELRVLRDSIGDVTSALEAFSQATDTSSRSTRTFASAVRILAREGLATSAMLSEVTRQAVKFRAVSRDATQDIFTRVDAVESLAEANEALAEAFRIDPASLPTMRTIIPRQALDIQPLTGEVKANFQAAVRTFQFDALTIIEDMTSTIGDALFDGFAAAFSAAKGERISSLFKELGATLLDGLGRIFSEMGKQLIGFGKIMEALRPALLNVFTAGPAAIAAGAALVALGGTLSGIAMRSRGTAAPSTSQLPSSRFQFRELEGEGKIIIQGGILDMSDPRQANALSRAISQLSGRRRITLQGA